MPNESLPLPAADATPGADLDAALEAYNRQNGIAPPPPPPLEPGVKLLGKYTVLRMLDPDSGGAELVLCAHEGVQYFARAYAESFAVDPESAARQRSVDSPLVVRLVETGARDGRPVEILPYYKNGSLQGNVLGEQPLTETVIPTLNEALRALRGAGIVHGRLSPACLLVSDDEKALAVACPGLRPAAEWAAQAPEYAAPEVFRGVLGESTDYYSMGITLFELFCGYAPFVNLGPEEIEALVRARRIPFPERVPARLKALITGLIGGFSEAGEPVRWGYDEVRRWLNGEDPALPGAPKDDEPVPVMPGYLFLRETYTDPAALARAFALRWEEGKREVFSGRLSAHLRGCLPELARICREAEAAANQQSDRADIIFWQLLCRLNPRTRDFFWKNWIFDSLPALGRAVLEDLWEGDDSRLSFCESLLAEKALSAYAARFAPGSEALKKAAAAIEASHDREAQGGTDMRRTLYLMGYLLSGQKLLRLGGEQFRSVGELADDMRGVLKKSYPDFEALCHRLVDEDGSLDPQLESWLIALGKTNELDQWRGALG